MPTERGLSGVGHIHTRQTNIHAARSYYPNHRERQTVQVNGLADDVFVRIELPPPNGLIQQSDLIVCTAIAVIGDQQSPKQWTPVAKNRKIIARQQKRCLAARLLFEDMRSPREGSHLFETGGTV